jgi:hypothetical protein
MKSSIIIVLLLALLVLAMGNSVQAAASVPALPETFYGALTINNQPAAPGALVEAHGTGVLTGIAGNPLTTSTAGAFGSSSATGSKLTVQGTVPDGTALTFWVNGVQASTSVSNIVYRAGDTLQLNLSVTTGGSTGGSTGNGGNVPNPPPATTSVPTTLPAITSSAPAPTSSLPPVITSSAPAPTVSAAPIVPSKQPTATIAAVEPSKLATVTAAAVEPSKQPAATFTAAPSTSSAPAPAPSP